MKIDTNGFCTYLIRGGSFSGTKMTIHHSRICAGVVLETHEGEFEYYRMTGVPDPDPPHAYTHAEYHYVRDVYLDS